MLRWIKRRGYINELSRLEAQLIRAIESASTVNGHDARTLEMMREDVRTLIRANMGNNVNG